MNQLHMPLKNSVLNEEQEKQVVHFYLTGGKTVTQTWIANHFGVSRKKIYNVLKERGALLNKQEMGRLLSLAQLVNEHDITPDKLRSLINRPALSAEVVVKELNKLEPGPLLEIVYQLLGHKYMNEQMAKELNDAA